MKICPVCNDSFADELNFCDIDGTRLTREGMVQERNKWWFLLGAGLLVGALVISAASIFFLPKARVSNPVVNSEPSAAPAVSKAPLPESTASVAAVASSEPESESAEPVVPEVKKRDKSLANSNSTGAAPNPKAAALAAEEADKKPSAVDNPVPPPPKPDPPPVVKSASDVRPSEPIRTQPPPDLKRERSPSADSRSSDKDGNKKKADDKDKKKGGFLRVFKKIFGKD